MKKLIFILVCICLSALAQAQTFPKNPNKTNAKGLRQGKWTILYNKDWKITDTNDSVMYFRAIAYDNDKPKGIVRDYYKNGKVQFEGLFLQDRPKELYQGTMIFYREDGSTERKVIYDKKGQLNGILTDYYPSGKTKEIIPFVLDKKEGEGRDYYENGTLNGIYPYKQDMTNGLVRTFYDNGKPYAETEYLSNIKNGKSVKYHSNGNKKIEEFFENGKLAGDQKEYFMNGQLKYQAPLKNEKWEGIVIYYDSLYGKKTNEITFSQDIKNGKMTKYYLDGQIERNANYKDGKTDGLFTEYHENGTISVNGSYILGEREGIWKWYFKSGKLDTEIASYTQGKRNGVQKEYDEKGTLIKEIFYENEKFVKGNSWRISFDEGSKIANEGKYDLAIPIFQKAILQAEKEFGKEKHEYATTQSWLGYAYLKNKQYTEAEKCVTIALQVFLKTEGKDGSNYLSTLAHLETIYKETKDFSKLIMIRTEQLQNTQLKEGKESEKYATSAHRLANAYFSNAQYDKALPLYTEVKEIRGKVLGKEHIDYGFSVYNIGHSTYKLEKYKEAIPYFSVAKEVFIKTKNTEDYNNTLDLMFYSYLAIYAYTETIEIGEELLPVYAKTVGKKDAYYTETVKYLILAYREQGDYVKAKIYGQELLSLKNDAETINMVANVYLLSADFEEAEKLYLQSLKIKRNSVTVGNLGLLYSNWGKYPKAEKLYLEAIEITKTEKQELFTLKNNLSTLYIQMGNYTRAEQLINELMQAENAKNGKQTANYALCLNNLARIYSDKGEHKKALQADLEALSIRTKILEPTHLDLISSLGNVASNYTDLENYGKAEILYKEVLVKSKKVLGESSINYANNINNLALNYANQRKYGKADSLYKISAKIFKKKLGEKHPMIIVANANFSELYRSMKRYDLLEKMSLENNKLILELINTNFIYLSEKEKLAFYNQYKVDINGFYGYSLLIANQNPTILGDAYNLNLATKSILFQSTEKVRNNIMNSGNKKLIEKYNDWKEKRSFLAKVYQMSEIERQKQNIQEQLLEQEANQIEKELTEQAGMMPKNAKNAYTWQDIQEKLLPNEVAIEIIRISKYRNKSQKKYMKGYTYLENENDYSDITKIENEQSPAHKVGMRAGDKLIAINSIDMKNKERAETNQIIAKAGDSYLITFYSQIQKKNITTTIKSDSVLIENEVSEPAYIALIVKADTKNQPELVILPNGNSLEKDDINYYRNNIKFKKTDKYSYNTFWKPIKDKIGTAKKVYFSTDGVYHQLNLLTLQNPENQKFVSEEVNIQLVSNTKDLIAFSKPKKLQKNMKDYKLHLFGFPDYTGGKGKNNAFNNTDRSAFATKLDTTQRFFNMSGSISTLPGTKTEVENIGGFAKIQNMQTITHIGEQASEENIKKLSNPDILHIATHGFFLSDLPVGNNEDNKMNDGKRQVQVENPLLRCGLLFADAENGLKNGEVEGKENGVLTAQEAMNLNLDNTDLVVMSACETGLGEIVNGEGVFGLQRAFQQAGAKTILMSLWKVDDAATQEMMSLFYENLLNKKLPKREAFTQAQNKLKEKYPSPYFWGAFVMVGE